MSLVFAALAWAHPGADLQQLATEPAIAEHPCDLDIWTARARALASDGRIDEALTASRRAESCGLEASAASLLQGVILAGAGRSSEALDALDRTLASHPTHGGALTLRSRILLGLGRADEALRDAEAAYGLGVRQPDDLLHLILLYRAFDDQQAALRVVDEAPRSPALIDQAVRIELALGRRSAALDRLNTLPSTPFWDARRVALLGAP